MSPRDLVLPVGRVFLRPGSFKKPIGWDFVRAGIVADTGGGIVHRMLMRNDQRTVMI